MSTNWATLKGTVEHGSQDTLVDFLSRLSETERSELADACQDLKESLSQELHSLVLSQPGRSPLTIEKQHAWDRALSAGVATGSVEQALRTGAQPGWPSEWYLPQIVSSRSNEWLEEWSEAPGSRWRFASIEPVVASQRIPEPESDEYVLGLIVMPYRAGKVFDLAEYLRQRPHLRGTIMRMFQVQGDKDTSLASADKYEHRTGRIWSETLHALVEEGFLDRSEVLTATLQALTSDWPAYRGQWMTAFHDRLKPTALEMNKHQQRYLQLLGSSTPAYAAFAVRHLHTLEKEGFLNEACYLKSAGPALSTRSRKAAVLALQIAVRYTLVHPDLSAALHHAALSSPHEVVRLRAGDLLP